MGTEEKAKEKRPFCPYCDEEIIQADFSYCRACQITIFHCPKCREPLPRDNRICPHCGAEIKVEKI